MNDKTVSGKDKLDEAIEDFLGIPPQTPFERALQRARDYLKEVDEKK